MWQFIIKLIKSISKWVKPKQTKKPIKPIDEDQTYLKNDSIFTQNDDIIGFKTNSNSNNSTKKLSVNSNNNLNERNIQESSDN